MENNHIFKYISRGELEEMLQAFYAITKLNVQLLDENGIALLSYGDKAAYCMEFARINKEGKTCAQEHARGAEMARDFGESYVFCCHSGLNHIVYPTMVKGRLFGSVIVGPFLMEKADASMITDLNKRKPIPAESMVRLMEYVGDIPLLSPDAVTEVSTLFKYLMRSVLVESREIIAANNEKLLQQSRINESIQMYKNSGAKDNRTYPIELETELINSIKANDMEKGREILNTLLGHILLYEGHDIEKVKIRIIELCSLLSRSSIGRGSDLNMVLDMNQRLISSIAESHSIYDVCYRIQENIEIFTDSLNQSPERSSRLVKNAKEYVAKHFSENITLSSVADELHVNPSYLSMLFRQVTGITFKEYINRIRVEEAERLLSNTDYPIIEIAVACGYSDQSYFTKVFKKYTGLTPRQYR